MFVAKPMLIVCLGVAMAAGLAGCRDDEQGRPLMYEEGVYGGQHDDPLTEEARERLRQRHAGQRW